MKILTTIGPVSESTNEIKKISKFTNLFRLNTSHNNLDWHKNVSKKIKKVNKNNKLLIDIPGIKPRTANKKEIKIIKNKKICFYFEKKPKNNFLKIPLTKPLPKINKKEKYFSVSDGTFAFRIVKSSKDFIIGLSLQNFNLKTMKGLNIPNSIYDNFKQSKLCLDFIKKIKKVNFDLVGLSFVQDEKIIKKVKKKYPKLLIVSKIENLEGVKNIDKIVYYSDIIMIDRGDLSAEIGTVNLFSSIKKISHYCKKYGKPLIMATENLESMMTKNLPTKSEILSISFYQNIGVDVIMLSDETAISIKFINIIKWLYAFLNNKKKIMKTNKVDLWNLISNKNNIPLVFFTKSGKSIYEFFKKEDTSNKYVFTESKKIVSLTKFKTNVEVFKISKFNNKNLQRFIHSNLKKFKNIIFKNSNLIMLIYVSFPRKNSFANTIQILKREDIN